MTPPPRTRSSSPSPATLKWVEKLQLALKRGNRSAVVQAIRQVIARRAPFGPQWRKIAHLAVDYGELTLAREAIDLFVESEGGSAAARFQKFDLLARTGMFAEAQDLLASLPEDVPDPVSNAFNRGALAFYLGEGDEAMRQLKKVTEVQPSMGQAWGLLAMVADFSSDAELYKRLLAAQRHLGRCTPDQLAAYSYALGKARADLGDHAEAIEAFQYGARYKKQQARYDREGVAATAAAAMHGYSAERIADIAGRQTKPTDRTIFVAGLPRSGTTLVEQILASHSEVLGGAELSLMRLLSQDIGGLDFPALSRDVEQRGPQWAARLWGHLLRERFPGTGRVVDKSVDGFFYFGLASALLPDAPLIWVKREPLDCAWSCFRTHFAVGLEWTNDLEDIAFHFRLADRLLAHWQAVLGDRLLIVPYEQLVAEPEQWTSRILGHCGLPAEDQCFAPHESQRAVSTASAMQVREPINRKSVGSAEPYRAWLEPFIAAYDK